MRDEKKDKIVLWRKKEDCCACGACISICPTSAILMKCDINGFEYPQIDKKKCVSCKMCQMVCPLKGG